MVTLIDLGAMFWRNALGGSDPMQGYTQTIDLLTRFRGERAIVCADSPRSERKERHEVYKSNPKPKEAVEALEGVMARAREWLPVAICDGWEADDVIATLTEQAWPEDVRIIGSEKDFYVLMDERVHLVKAGGTLVRANDCVDKFGVAPSQMTDWLAIVGDAADGVPGCPGIGPAGATTLLGIYGNLDAIRAAAKADAISVPGLGPKKLEALATWDPTMALELVRMRADLPLRLEDYLP
jgi:5'-3' exonuclease